MHDDTEGMFYSEIVEHMRRKQEASQPTPQPIGEQREWLAELLAQAAFNTRKRAKPIYLNGYEWRELAGYLLAHVVIVRPTKAGTK